jgi:hypothetical protein
MVNKVGLPWVALPTFLNFSCFHTFQDGGLGIIWDANSSKMEKPNVDEQKRAMGFHTCTIIMRGIFEGVHRRILGQVMDHICLTWIFKLYWAKQV